MHCYLTLVISTKSAVTDPCKRRTLSFAEQECAQEFREKMQDVADHSCCKESLFVALI